MDNLDYKVDKGAWHKYGVSEAGNILHSKEFPKQHWEDGIISVPVTPGNLKTNPTNAIVGLLLHHPIYGAYTELFAGLSPEVTMEKSRAWIAPWGRFLLLRKDFEAASKTEVEGGTGVGLQFWDWTEEQVKPYL